MVVREHIFRDLRPYVCTYVDCEIGDQVYDSWKDWTTHERWAHNKAWRCAEHTNDSYYSAVTFKEHLRQDHNQAPTESELDQLLHVSEITSDNVIRGCPFCHCTIHDAHQLSNHIATHLQRVALFALPRSHDIQDASEAGSSSSQANALDRGSQNLGVEDESNDGYTEAEPANDDLSDRDSGYKPPPTKLTLEAIENISTLDKMEDRLQRLGLSVHSPSKAVNDSPKAVNIPFGASTPARLTQAVEDFDDFLDEPSDKSLASSESQHNQESNKSPTQATRRILRRCVR